MTLKGFWGETYSEWLDIRFTRSDDTGYSDWDYTLRCLVQSEHAYPPLIGPGKPGPIAYIPEKGTTAAQWIGTWVGDGIFIVIDKKVGWHDRLGGCREIAEETTPKC